MLGLKLVDSMILPILNYAKDIWGPTLYQKLNKDNINRICEIKLKSLLPKFMRYLLLGVHSKSSNAGVRIIWSSRNMTPMGRVIIVKTCIISQLTYLFLNLPSLPSEYFLQIDKLIFNFIWNSKVDKIKLGYMRLRMIAGPFSK